MSDGVFIGMVIVTRPQKLTPLCCQSLCLRDTSETLSPREAAHEDIMLEMRMSRGVSFELVKKAMGFTPNIMDIFEELIALDLVKFQDARYQPTTHGWLLGNELFDRIWSS